LNQPIPITALPPCPIFRDMISHTKVIIHPPNQLLIHYSQTRVFTGRPSKAARYWRFATMMLPSFLVALSILLHNDFAAAGSPIVSLSYGTFQGLTEGTLTKFLGVPFGQAYVQPALTSSVIRVEVFTQWALRSSADTRTASRRAECYDVRARVSPAGTEPSARSFRSRTIPHF
jgi:hypothetical protein